MAKTTKKRIQVKSVVTITLIITLSLLTLGTAAAAIINGTSDMFNTVFTIFASTVGAVVAYFFKKDDDAVKSDDTTDGDVASTLPPQEPSVEVAEGENPPTTPVA